MFPKRLSSFRASAMPGKRQRGFLIPLALFIVVVMGLLALALSRTTTQTGLATAQELISLQAFYAAESGAQAGMQALFYNNTGSESSFTDVSAACQTLELSINFNASGLNNCRVSVSCDCETCT